MNNKYQKRDVSIQEVIDRIQFSKQDIYPDIILSISPCRSGTTVLLRVFGQVGVQSHYQQLKNILRWRMQGDEFNWQIPYSTEVLYLKETLGPYTHIEAQFNPLGVLLKAGVPAEKLKIIIIGRHPSQTWASWLSWWKDVTQIDIFIQAYQTTESIRQNAIQLGFKVGTFIYETTRDLGAGVAIQHLLKFLGIPFKPSAVQGWHSLAGFGTKGSNVVFPHEPAVFDIPDLHLSVEEADGLKYKGREKEVSDLPSKDVNAIEKAGIFDIYQSWLQACSEDMGFNNLKIEGES